LSKAKLALQNYRFKLWRLSHPDATFKNYFAAIAKDDLARGRQHPSCGEHLKWGDRANTASRRRMYSSTMAAAPCAWEFMPSGIWSGAAIEASISTRRCPTRGRG
jgi:hypothetical protein